MSTSTKNTYNRKVKPINNGTIENTYENMSRQDLIEQIEKLKSQISDYKVLEQQREERKQICITGLNHLLNGQVFNNGVNN